MFFDLDHWQEIRNTMAANRLRSALTAFGIFWGIFLLILLLGSGSGLERGVSQGFSGTATNSFFLWSMRTAKSFRGQPAGRRLQLTTADVAAIRQQVPEAEVIAPRNQLGGFRGGNNVRRGRKTGGFSVVGDHPEVLHLQSLKIASGRFLNPIDLAERRKVAVLGKRVADVLFEAGEDPIGESIEVRGVFFKVVGIFRDSQPGQRGEESEQTIYVPFTTFQSAFNFGDRVGWLAITSRAEVPVSTVEERVLELLRQRHTVAPDDSRAFGHFNLEKEFQKIQGLFGGIRLLMWVVGLGTLLAGAIGVSNIMLIVVRERTKEIGIRRAIGARPRAIVLQILFEALLLTAVAGYAGLVAGVGLLELVARFMPRGDTPSMFVDPGVDFAIAVRALILLSAAGLFAGSIPARHAVSVPPVIALRTE
jgi:putative ABC transport system permease protein